MPRGRPKKQEDLLVRSAEMIGWALGGIEREIALTRERLSTLTSQANVLRTKLGRRAAAGAGVSGDADTRTMNEGKAGTGKRRRRRRKMSAEARKRISDMMKKRWAERRKAKG